MATSTYSVYASVIEDVINKMREEFTNNGLGEDVLKELQGTWEAKMMQSSQVPSQTPLIQPPLPETRDNLYNIPSGSPSPSPSYTQSPSPWMNQRAPLKVSIPYVEGRGKREDFASQYEEGDDDEPPLNEDDDVEEEEEEEASSIEGLVLAQFDKVTQAKGRYRCALQDGIMHINNKDILFSKGTGDFDFHN